MGVTGKKYTDFFVFTFKGWHKERIYFDPKFWSDVLKTLVWFWYKYVGPELITHELKNHLEKEVLPEKDTDVAPSSVTKSPKDQSIVLVSCKVSRVKKPKQIKSMKEKAKNRKKVWKTERSTVFLCGICKMDVSDNLRTFNEESVGCDSCPIWYHFGSVGITMDTVLNKKDTWICPQCKTI